MSPLFGKKKAEEMNPENENTWQVYQVEENGAPLVVRIDTRYKKFKDSKKYDHQVGIAIPLNNPHEGGLPEADENATLLEIEEKLESLLCGDEKTLFVATLTTGIMKELVLYTSVPRTVDEQVQSFAEQVSSHTIQLMIQPDKDWNIYKSFLP